MRQRDLREAVNRLVRVDGYTGHAGNAGEHPVDQCRYCARWVEAVLNVWDLADQHYGPRTIAEGVRDIAHREATRPISAP